MSAPTQTSFGIFVNDRPHVLAGPAPLASLLVELGLSQQRGVAAAVNGEVVPRSAWGLRMLEETDRVLVIRATQGG